MRAIKGGWAAMKMAHAKLIHMENGGVALSLVFRYVTCQIWVGVNVYRWA